ncbi:FeoA family protein [Desulfofarcimen acetoxidans DSM 771]|uniref:FeoA family protein n=1 Tax=Desulfofarcimen acetoxidans (strain ATCC 49208 / DSM 771 / KCTC 5769 / VKM B-1644 / 5575) TaxID=485916 RepID=C8VWF8_DESAS|nr:ferrous iron transport protein A [Desulfofarcimen acetoxidans]ACV62510.1 FeoA family protein [Desulfofarcimen acetoxidans DSM 771]
MKLDKIKKGQTCRIVSIPSQDIRTQVIRFGIAEGELVCCAEIVPAGPVIIRKNRQEIAFGRSLAKQIDVVLN